MRSVFVLFLAALAIPAVVGGQRADGANTNADVEKQILKIDDEKDHAMQRYVASHGEDGGPDLDRIYGDDLGICEYARWASHQGAAVGRPPLRQP